MNKIFLTLFFLLLSCNAYAATFTLHADKASKATPVDADIFGIEDSAATWGVKHVTLGNLKTYMGQDIALDLGALSDLKYDGATMVDDTKGNGDTTFLWSADKTFDQLALKAPLDNTTVTSTATGTGNILLDGADGTRDYNYSNGASAATYTPIFTTPPASGKVREIIATFGGGAGVCTMTWTNVTRWIGDTGAAETTTNKRSTYAFWVYNSEVVGKIIQEAY